MNDARPFPNPAAAAAAAPDTALVGAVVIGRNEGQRLVACLASLRGRVARLVYVDSGSTDGSVAAARAAGALVVELDRGRAFTAARARNAGLAALTKGKGRAPAYIQFVDGDCTVDPDWIARATGFLGANPGTAVVCGRRRERHPEASVYNRLCDWEWDTPIGPALSCGGDALMRTAAVRSAGGYAESLIAGEEPELCLRLRRAGWSVWRIDAEMTLHDAAIHRLSQWWRRSRRAGYAFAEGAALHGAPPDRHWVAETRRALAWALVPPALTVALAAALAMAPARAGWAALLIHLIYPLQVVRLAVRAGIDRRSSWERAVFMVLSKFPEAVGIAEYRLMRLKGGRSLIEYK